MERLDIDLLCPFDDVAAWWAERDWRPRHDPGYAFDEYTYATRHVLELTSGFSIGVIVARSMDADAAPLDLLVYLRGKARRMEKDAVTANLDEALALARARRQLAPA